MQVIPLAPGYTEQICWDSTDPKAKGRLAYHSASQRCITYYPRWWLKPIWSYIYPIIKNHERGHSHGIRRCLGEHSWCIMAEETAGKDSWVGKLVLWPNQLWHGITFCETCAQYLRDKTIPL